MRPFLGFRCVPIAALTLGSACASDEHEPGNDNLSQMRDAGQAPDTGSPSVGGGGASGSPSIGDGGGARAGTGGVEILSSSEIYPCPGYPYEPPPQTDPVMIQGFTIEGESISLEISYSGGCADHSFGLCYGSLGMSAPPYAGVNLLHDANGDSCEALITQTLTFDLAPFGERYLSDGGLFIVQVWTRDSTGVAVPAERELYRRGVLECEERIFAAQWDTQNMPPPNLDCSTTQDCQWASLNTACSVGCGTVVSTSGEIEVSSTVQRISEETCGNFVADGCQPPDYSECAEPPSVDCVAGQCVELP